MKRHIFTFTPVSLALLLAATGCAPEEAQSDAVQVEPLSSLVRDVSVNEAKALIEGPQSPAVIDVRTGEEFAAGHIDGALNIDFLGSDFAGELAKLDKNQPVLIHCKSGTRSTKALAELEAQGFENIAHMTGGYDAWEAEFVEAEAVEGAGK